MTRTLRYKIDQPGNPRKLEELRTLFMDEGSDIIDLKFSPSFVKRTGFSKLAWEAFLRALVWGGVINADVTNGVWTVEALAALPTTWSDSRPSDRHARKMIERVAVAKTTISDAVAEEKDELSELKWALKITRGRGLTVDCIVSKTVVKTVVEETNL